MTRVFTPERWAIEITHLLNAVLGAVRFLVDIPAIARDYTAQRFPDDPIINVQGDKLRGFDGALFRAPAGRKGWGIIYNNRISSKGRINFTLAHEFGQKSQRFQEAFFFTHGSRYIEFLMKKCDDKSYAYPSD